MSSPETPSHDAVEQITETAAAQLTIELGQTALDRAVAEQLQPGALIALEEFSDDPVAIYSGSKLVGRGEVLLIDGQLGVRITELYGSATRRV
ncbi:MAG: flagellar motor switch protein FliN [Planctomycetaceae bacterium]|nr:flagellar motor switch protein FliN [Planctomycetaceae bacterium]